MKDKDFLNNLIIALESSTSSYKTIEYIKNILNKYKYKKLGENENWKVNCGRYYITRNDASIIAFEIPENFQEKFQILTTHSDTPSLYLKPNGENIKDGFLKHNVMPYGGLLNYGWLDHPLSVSGRVIYKNNKYLSSKIIDLKKTCFIIPSVAIHQNEKANTNLDIDAQIDMQPIMGLSENNKDLKKFLEKELNIKNVIDYDLHLYNNTLPQSFGTNNELLFSPRIDNITSVYAGINGFIDSLSDSIKVLCSFNSEEIGSLTIEGADSNFLVDTVKKICKNLNIDFMSAINNSFLISSDNTHAVHPNHSEYSDITGKAYLGKGLLIIKEPSSVTNGITSSIIKSICDKEHIKYQISTSKNNLNSGSSLSMVSIRHLNICSIDIGISQLSMHSSCEVCSIKDIYELYKLIKAFYEYDIDIKKEIIKIEKRKR